MNMHFAETFRIGEKEVGGDSPLYIVAELSANHLQDKGRALELLHAAAEAGADAFKLQTYTPDTITLNSERPEFAISGGTPWDGDRLYSLYEKAYTPWEWHAELCEEAKKLGLACFSSPFDFSAVDFLKELQVPAMKIASYEIADIPLIRYVAGAHVPMILSTGIARLSDIEDALSACYDAGNNEVMLLKCVSEYPTPFSEVNLRMLPTLRQTFGCPVGLSDHTLGDHMAVAAAALGAKLLEKHLTLRRSDGGPDGAFSMEPEEFRLMVRHIRETEEALGDRAYHLTPAQETEREGGRSLYVVKEMKAGEAFTAENIRSVRPAAGLAPKYYDRVLKAYAAEDIPAGTPLSLSMVRFQNA